MTNFTREISKGELINYGTSIVLVLSPTLSWGSTGQAYLAIDSFVWSRGKLFWMII